MYILQFACLINDNAKTKTKDVLERDNQKIIRGLIISVINLKEKITFASKITTHLNTLCVHLPNGLIQLNEISTGILLCMYIL